LCVCVCVWGGGGGGDFLHDTDPWGVVVYSSVYKNMAKLY